MSAICLDLTLVCVHVHVCVCAHECMSVPVYVANHFKEQRSGSVVMTSDPGMLQERGRVAEEEKKTRSNIPTHLHKEKGGIHSRASKFTTARKTTTDRDIAICLVNSYGDL